MVEFMEASQFEHYYSQLEAGIWGALPFVIAVLARPVDEEGNVEEYDEEKTMLRGEMFKELRLDWALNVGFFLMRRSEVWKRNSLFYIAALQLRNAKQELKN